MPTNDFTNMQICMASQFLFTRSTSMSSHHLWKIRISQRNNVYLSFFSLDDNRPEESETHDHISGNWWLNFVAVQSEVTQSRTTLVN